MDVILLHSGHNMLRPTMWLSSEWWAEYNYN